MTSRVLLSGTLASAAVRRKRKADGAVFAVAKIRDTDRYERREWTAFANDLDVIEALEEMRVGEPIAVTGPFSSTIGGTEREPRIEHRITAEALLGSKRKRKPKGKITKEQRVELDEIAPSREDPNDELPF